MDNPSAEDLLIRGLFHDRIVPPLSSLSLYEVANNVISYARREMKKAPDKRRRTRLVRHSVPKMKHLRRHFAVPNPYSQAMLCICVAKNWKSLEAVCKKSPVSLSRPVPSTKRALAAEYSRRVEGVRRSQSSVGMRFMLKTDIATFYPSIYTHSIPWAIHGKATARSKRAKNWYGNDLDKWVRETQDKQTGGIPIGPDTSFLIAEVVASRMDSLLEKTLGKKVKGVRYIDDYHLYFPTRGGAEKALAALHTVTQAFELQLNGLKTGIFDVPEPIEPSWKTDLRLIRVRSDQRATGIKAFFDRASDLAAQFPSDSVLTYAVRKVTRYADRLNEKEWEVCRSLLLRSCLGEPTMLPALLELFERKPESWDATDLQSLLTELCLYHAPLQHGFEVAWSLWLARTFAINLPEKVAVVLRKVDDDIVALVALDLESQGLLPKLDSKLWMSRMTKEHLYSDHWLLAYEAYVQDWLPSADGDDYVRGDPFFSILAHAGARFYSSEQTWEDGYSDYSDGDDEFDDDEDDDEDDELETDIPEESESPISPEVLALLDRLNVQDTQNIPAWAQPAPDPTESSSQDDIREGAPDGNEEKPS
jgi:hypothetical protein